MIKKVCVFCGSSFGKNPLYQSHVQILGQTLAQKGLTLVYGGSRLGLMGVLADSALKEKGRVVGVMPQALVDQGRAHESLPDLRVVKDMHERKQLMASLSDAFIVVPGGIGTLEETLEQVAWNQLGLQHKPLGFLNSGAYYDPFVAFLEYAAREGFIPAESVSSLLVENDPLALLEKILKPL
jgi:uncharacterized protein (TIGR00730 family)